MRKQSLCIREKNQKIGMKKDLSGKKNNTDQKKFFLTLQKNLTTVL